jgi:hypothetical protein
MTAFEKLAKTTGNPTNQYNCYRYAGYSARKSKQHDKAIAFADKIGEIKNPYKYLAMVRKLEALYYAKKYKQANEMITREEILEWPKTYGHTGLYFLGLAQYQLKKGKEAEKTFALGVKNASSDSQKGIHHLKSATNYQHRLKDPDKAMESYRALIKVPKAHPNHKATGYEAIASMLRGKKKNSDAIAEYDKALALEKLGGYWKARILGRKADTLKIMGKKAEAIKTYNQAIATKGCPGWIKKGAQKNLKALQAKKKK